MYSSTVAAAGERWLRKHPARSAWHRHGGVQALPNACEPTRRLYCSLHLLLSKWNVTDKLAESRGCHWLRFLCSENTEESVVADGCCAPAYRACNTHPLHVGRQKRGKNDVFTAKYDALSEIFVSFSDAKVFALQQRSLQANLHVRLTCSFRLQMLRGATTVARLRSSASWQTLGTGARTHLTSSAASICKRGLLIAFSSPLPKSGAFRCQQSRQVTTTFRAMAGKARDSLAETNGGAFVRKDSVFRDWIEEGGKFPPEGERNDACQAGLDFGCGDHDMQCMFDSSSASRVTRKALSNA